MLDSAIEAVMFWKNNIILPECDKSWKEHAHMLTHTHPRTPTHAHTHLSSLELPLKCSNLL